MLKYLHEKKYQTKKARFAHTECKVNQPELQGLEIGKSRSQTSEVLGVETAVFQVLPVSPASGTYRPDWL